MKLYNTLTREKEEFRQIYSPVRMYVCGVTTYDEPHLGHALATVIFEVLQRYMEYRGIAVKRVQNFTDVDDKIIARAAELDLDWYELTQMHVESFLKCMDGLNVRRADVHPRVTEEMPAIIAIISELIDMGAAYESDGSVYYRVRSDDDYGKLSRRTNEDTSSFLARLEPDLGKENAEDFALWKAWKEGEPGWQSPWGKGRPGWHIECSAMARNHLGDQIDIHGGGLDLVFPHHENEIAQSETATRIVPFARCWMHNGLLRMAGDEKMSKSLGNVVTVRKALETYSADAIRLWIFQSHYRSPAHYDDENIAAAERAVRRIREAASRVRSANEAANELDPSPYRQRFVEAMDDDLNTPRALAAIFDLVSEIFKAIESSIDVSAAQDALLEFTSVLGMTLEEPKREGTLSEAEIEELIATRNEARRTREYTQADAIRDRLADMGIELADAPSGTTWRWR